MNMRIAVRRSSDLVLLSLLLAITAFANSASAQQARPLFAPLTQNGANLTVAQEDALAKLRGLVSAGSIELVSVDSSALRDSAGLTQATQMTLPSSGGVLAALRDSTLRAEDDFTWFGSWSGGSGSAVLVFKDGTVTGAIQDGVARYSLVPIGGNLSALVAVNWAKFPGEVDPVLDPASMIQPIDPATTFNPQAGPVQVDILVAYTTNARLAYPGAGGMSALAQLAVDITNDSYANSGINIVMNLVGTIEVGYNEYVVPDWSTILDDLVNGNGVLGAVHTRRDQVDADLVEMFIDSSTLCGLAKLLSHSENAYSLSSYACAADFITLAHETGHNFGAEHDPLASQPPNYAYAPYAAGFVHDFATNDTWRTVMAYSTSCVFKGPLPYVPGFVSLCPNVPYFSNPNVSYLGYATGTSGQNNARVLNERAATVAGFRPLIPATCSLSVSPSTVAVNENFTISWTSTNATSGSIDHGVGSVSPVSGGTMGPYYFSSPGSITFNGTFSGPGGAGNCQVAMNVTGGSVAFGPAAVLGLLALALGGVGFRRRGAG